jgi:predicted NUDIX family phosphoesterase
LVGGYIIGVGGHVELEDARLPFDVDATLHVAAMREIREEIGCRCKPERLHRMICTDIELSDNEVNSAHLGIVYVFDTSARSMKNVPADELEFVGWKTRAELKTYELESWSQFVLENAL